MNRTKRGWLIAGTLALIVTISIISMALASSVFATSGAAGYGGMMGSNGHGGMMGGGYDGMMGGYDLQGTPAVGVTGVKMTDQDAFSPTIVQVPEGTTVTWTNTDSDAHTVTFMPMWVNSGDVLAGNMFRHTFTTPGVYYYRCLHHPRMVGEVIVTA